MPKHLFDTSKTSPSISAANAHDLGAIQYLAAGPYKLKMAEAIDVL